MRSRTAIEEAFDAEARRGVQLAIVGRGACFVLLWASFADNAHWKFDNELLLYRTSLVGLALLTGLLSFSVTRRARDPVAWSYPVLLADFLLAGALVFGWQPSYLDDYPRFLAVRFQDVLFFVAVLGFSILPLSRRLPLIAAVAAALTWCAGVAQAWFTTPGARTSFDAVRDTGPDVLNLDYLGLQIVGLLALGLLLARLVADARRLVEARVAAARDRDRLASFFPPAVLQTITDAPNVLADRNRDVVVLFIDFDRARQGAASLAELDAYFAACERIIFAHGGIIDRFAGDPVMASFGALDGVPGQGLGQPALALAAWRCARTLHREISGLKLGCAGVGLVLGPALVGELGSERQRVFSVAGETTNLASRLLAEARRRRLACVMTQTLAACLPADTTSGLQDLGPVAIRGFPDPIRLCGAGA